MEITLIENLTCCSVYLWASTEYGNTKEVVQVQKTLNKHESPKDVSNNIHLQWVCLEIEEVSRHRLKVE